MKKFVLGLIVSPMLIGLAAYVYLSCGYLSMRADRAPSSFESRTAMRFLDASVGRWMPEQANPVASSDANLIDAVNLYKTHCAVCHGAAGHPEAHFGHPFYPPAPQFMKEPTDMPEYENFYIIKHGVRWTGMPAWGIVLSDQQIWQLTSFLAHMEKLPPGVQKEWQKLPQAGPVKQNTRH